MIAGTAVVRGDIRAVDDGQKATEIDHQVESLPVIVFGVFGCRSLILQFSMFDAMYVSRTSIGVAVKNHCLDASSMATA